MRSILAMMLASACFTLNESMVKLSAAELPIGQIMMFRGLGAALLVVILIALSRVRGTKAVDGDKPWRARYSPLIWLVGLGEMGAGGFAIAAVSMMPVANFTAILQSAPLVLTASAALFLGEAVGWRRWTALAVGFTGVMLIVRPGTDAFQMVSLLPLAGVMFSAVRDLSARRMGTRMPPLVMALATSLAVCPAGLVIGIEETWVMPSISGAMTLGLASLFLVGAYVSVIMAVRLGPLSISAPFRYSAVIFATLLGYIFWGDLPDGMTILGTAIIISAGLYSFARERRRAGQSA